MAHWNAWWWSPDEWRGEDVATDADRAAWPQGGGGGGGPAYAAADPSVDPAERQVVWPDGRPPV